MKLLRNFLILSHRYLGIAISLLVVVWFASGIVMMYAGGMPSLTREMRLEHLPALDLSRVLLTPSEAVDRGGDGEPVTLLSVMGRPAYRIAGTTTVFADTGEVLSELSLEQSKTVASRFLNLPEEKLRHAATLTDVDQWTLGQGRQLPLYKFVADDGNGTEVYVQPDTAEVVMLTTRRTRALAWIGTIPHWLYFTQLRTNQPVWYQIVVWTSGLACVLTVLGLALGITQAKRPKPFRLKAAIPYSGWMRWHYIVGVIFGVFTLTFAFSGLLSMEPFEWTRATGLEVPRSVFTGGPVDLAQFPAIDPVKWNTLLEGRAIKELQFARIQDEPYYVVRYAPDEPTAAQQRERLHQPYNVTGQAEENRLLVAAKTLEIRRQPFSVESLMARLRTAFPNVPIVEQQLLPDYDSYYYSRGRQTPLPVLRVKAADPTQTWIYIDPQMSQVLAQVHRLNRVERWLYSGLHNLDFSFWYNRRPLWDIGMIALLLGGLVSSVIGLCLGVKRLRRGFTRKAAPWAGAPLNPKPRDVVSTSAQ